MKILCLNRKVRFHPAEVIGGLPAHKVKRSMGKWEGRRWYVYDNGDKVLRYTQFTNEVISPEKFLFLYYIINNKDGKISG